MTLSSFSWRLPLLFLFPILLGSQQVDRPPSVQYTISLAHPEQHLFHVTMYISDVHGSLILQMPAWNALYQIRDFSAHVQGVRFRDPLHSQSEEAERVDKQTWRVQGDGNIIVSYPAYWDESGPFATQLNGDHAFINPAMILMNIPERRGQPVSVEFDSVPDGWRPTGATKWRAGSLNFQSPIWHAENFTYDELVDAPIEVGKFQEFDLPEISPRVTVVVHGDNWSKKRVEEDLTKICKYEVKLMDGAPFEHYTFILHIGKGSARRTHGSAVHPARWA